MTNAERIIARESDVRVQNMVYMYILDKGIQFCKEITDEDISEIEGNGLMTADFVQSLVRAARAVSTECKLDEIMNEIFELQFYTKANRITIWRDDFASDENFEEIQAQADCDGDTIDGWFIAESEE